MSVLILGAGKIARGFIGHLLWKSGLKFTFLEANAKLVELLTSRGSYTLTLLGEKPVRERIEGFDAVWTGDRARVLDLVAGIPGRPDSGESDLIFISVGGKNLKAVGTLLREALGERMRRGNSRMLNIVLCENWTAPADVIAFEVREGAHPEFLSFLDEHTGITEAVIMRSAIDPTPAELEADPLTVNVQNYWHLPIDSTRVKGASFPEIAGVEYLSDFQGFLERKFYTYNAANGTASYLGYLKGYTYISEAAHDPDILRNLHGVYEETARALSKKLGYSYEKQLEFTRTSLAKLQDRYLVDYIERNARDPIRKLGPSDRLVGPARLVVQFGGTPAYLAESIAAAIHYDNPVDPVALELVEIRKTRGVPYILEHICRLGPADGMLSGLVLEKTEELRRRGWIRED